MDDPTLIVALAGVGGTLLGVTIGELLGDWRQERAFKRQKAWERSQLRREKLELIATTANEEYSRLVDLVTQLRNISVVQEEGDFGDEAWREIHKQQKELGSARLPFLEMLIAFYAPELGEQIDSLKATHRALGRPIIGVITGTMLGEDASTEGSRVLQEAQSACRELIEAAAKLAREELGHNHSTPQTGTQPV